MAILLEAPGRWIGSGLGALHRDGPVAPTDLESLLAGINPDTAQTLVAARGSSARAAATRAASRVARNGSPDELLTAGDVAQLLGTNSSYVRRLAERHTNRETSTVSPETDSDAVPAMLAGERPSSGWRFRRGDVEAFAATRHPPAAIVGYDVTFSVPKSVSLLWAITENPAVRDEVTAALDTAVRAGIDYLERTRRGSGPGQSPPKPKDCSVPPTCAPSCPGPTA